jgi:hypothetical protein
MRTLILLAIEQWGLRNIIHNITTPELAEVHFLPSEINGLEDTKTKHQQLNLLHSNKLNSQP